LAFSVVLVLLCANVEAQTRQFKVCVPDYAVGVMPLIIGKQNGFYAQEQLDVEVIAARGHLCSMGLLANSFQFTYSPSTFDAVVAGGGQRKKSVFGGKIFFFCFFFASPNNNFGGFEGRENEIYAFCPLSALVVIGVLIFPSL